MNITKKEITDSLQILKEACATHPHYKAKIAVDSLGKGYISSQQAAEFMNLGKKRWDTFLKLYREGNLERVAPHLRNLVPPTETRFLTGFTNEQLQMLERALELPILIAKHHEGLLPLLTELHFLMVLGVILAGKHKSFQSFKIKVLW